jgi:hypothetical protein
MIMAKTQAKEKGSFLYILYRKSPLQTFIFSFECFVFDTTVLSTAS